MTHTTQAQLTTENTAAAGMPTGLGYAARCNWIAKRDMLVRVSSAAPEVAAADFETTITVVVERGLIFVVIDNGQTEKQHRVLDAEEIARIARKHGVVVGNVYFEECSDGFIRRVRGLITTSADTTALLAVEYASGVDYFDRLDRAADAPTPIWIHTTTEAAFAVACIKRRKTAAALAAA